MNLDSLSKQQLEENLRAMQQRADPGAEVDRLEQVVQELQVHRIELEMQNRALRETQAELEQSIVRYVDLYDHLPIGYVTLTARGRITEANLAAAELMKRERPKLIGSYLRVFLDADTGLRLADHLQACTETSGPVTLEVKLQADDGSVREIQLSSQMTPVAAGREQMVRTALTDISTLKQTQRTLDELNREQETFNRSISHDLRAPLVTISNYAKLVLSDFGPQLPPDGQNMLHRIQLAALRMEQLMLRLLEYNSMPRENVALFPVDLDACVHEWVVEQRALLHDCDLTVERPLPAVLGTRDLVRQVVANLLSNAIKFTAPGQSPRVRVAAEVCGHRVVLTVADSGIGIPEKNQDRIFRLFERLHGYSLYAGTGVGLSIVRRAVERMAGRVWVESEPGKGSKFHVELAKA